MKKVIVFDLDGTLIDTLIDLRNAVNFSMRYFNYPERSLEQVRKDIGNGVAKLVERSIPNGICNKNYQKCLEIFKNEYRKKYDVYTKPYEGMYEQLLKLQKEGYIVTVATNKIIDVAKILLDHHYPHIFDFIQGDAEGVKKKPDANMIENIINHYKVSKEEVLYIGDTNVDEETALNANVDYMLVTYGYRTIEEIKRTCQCTNLIYSTKEIFDKIRKLF